MISTPFILNNVFYGISTNADLVINSGKLSAYENTIGWGYTFFKRIYEYGSDPDATITLSNESISAEGKANTKTVNITTTATWSILSKPEWIATSSAGATGNATISLAFGANTGTEATTRTGMVIFKLSGTNAKDTLNLTQYTNKYSDGDYETRQTHTTGNGINVVFMGDGFTLEEIVSGAYEQAMNLAITHFFDIEPYTTYRNYFDVHVVYVYSKESGCSDLTTTKNTALSVKYTGSDGSTAMSSDDDACFDYAESVPDVDLKKALVIVVPNSTRYGGTTWMWSTGEAIAICPMPGNSYPYDFRGIVQHEAGGHGFGGLADEYVNYTNTTIPIPTAAKLLNWQDLGFYKNVDLTNNLTEILWKNFVGLSAYSYVGAFEGAYLYSTGVWRPEEASCMINNIKYYNAPSREMIVKRIMSRSGGTYSFTDFQTKDVMQLSAETKAATTIVDKSKMLAEPVLTIGSPKRK